MLTLRKTSVKRGWRLTTALRAPFCDFCDEIGRENVFWLEFRRRRVAQNTGKATHLSQPSPSSSSFSPFFSPSLLLPHPQWVKNCRFSEYSTSIFQSVCVTAVVVSSLSTFQAPHTRALSLSLGAALAQSVTRLVFVHSRHGSASSGRRALRAGPEGRRGFDTFCYVCLQSMVL